MHLLHYTAVLGLLSFVTWIVWVTLRIRAYNAETTRTRVRWAYAPRASLPSKIEWPEHVPCACYMDAADPTLVEHAAP